MEMLPMALDVKYAVITGNRQPLLVREVLPFLHYDCFGPGSTAFDATCILSPHCENLTGGGAVCRPERSLPNRITAASVGDSLVVVGFYVPLSMKIIIRSAFEALETVCAISFFPVY